jgi:hypothetical protein
MMAMQNRITSLASAASLAVVLMPPGPSAGRPSPGPDFRVRDESTISRTLRFGGSGERTLDVRAIHGSIRVIGADRSDVQLEARKTVSAETDADLRVAGRDVVLDIVDNAARIEAIVREVRGDACGENSGRRGSRWWELPYAVTFDFTIQVPRGTRLNLCTVNGREILVEGTSGDFELDNVNGRITMQNVRGSGSARTVNAAIVASFAEPPRAASEFRTTNGNVVVTFPANLAADLRMKTFNGGLFTDFDVQDLPQPATVAERRDGRFVYRSNQFTLVRAGGGGPELTFETFNGNVRVLRAAR